MKSQERVVIDISREGFTDAILMALEKDTGVVPIVPEILRILKIRQRKEQIAETRLKNLARANEVRRHPANVEIRRRTWWDSIRLYWK